jgi:voltage-gated potassium channel
VVIEKDNDCRFLAHAKSSGVPVLIRDMKDDSALLEAGVPHARVVIVATNDDMANIEVGLDSRRMNPKIRILMRLYDQQIAAKISGALSIDLAFSASALAAPIVAAMSLDTRVINSFLIGSTSYSILEVTVEAGSAMAGRKISQLEKEYSARVLARTPSAASVHSPPAFEEVVASGDTLVVSLETSRLAALAAECKLKKSAA